VQSSSQIITTNRPTSNLYFQAGCPSCRPTNTVRALKEAMGSKCGTIKHYGEVNFLEVDRPPPVHLSRRISRTRPRKTWSNCVKEDMKRLGLSQGDSQSRNKCRSIIKGYIRLIKWPLKRCAHSRMSVRLSATDRLGLEHWNITVSGARAQPLSVSMSCTLSSALLVFMFLPELEVRVLLSVHKVV